VPFGLFVLPNRKNLLVNMEFCAQCILHAVHLNIFIHTRTTKIVATRQLDPVTWFRLKSYSKVTTFIMHFELKVFQFSALNNKQKQCYSGVNWASSISATVKCCYLDYYLCQQDGGYVNVLSFNPSVKNFCKQYNWKTWKRTSSKLGRQGMAVWKW